MLLRSSPLLATLLLAGASSAFPSPAGAAEPQPSCPAAPALAHSEKKQRKSLGLGGLLKAVQRSGAGNLVGAESLGDGKLGQVAGVAGAIASGADPASAAAGVAGNSRAGALVGAAIGTAAELARSAKPDCGGSIASASDAEQEFTPTR